MVRKMWQTVYPFIRINTDKFSVMTAVMMWDEGESMASLWFMEAWFFPLVKGYFN